MSKRKCQETELETSKTRRVETETSVTETRKKSVTEWRRTCMVWTRWVSKIADYTTARYDTGVKYCTRCWKYEVEFDVSRLKQHLHEVRNPQLRTHNYPIKFMLSQMLMLLHANVGCGSDECTLCQFIRNET